MSIKEKFFQMMQRSFGTKRISSAQDFEDAEKDLTTSMNSAQTASENEFDKSLKVDGIQQKSNINYSKLPQQVKKDLERNFEELKKSILTGENLKNNQLLLENEGSVEKSPFICYTEIDSSGKIQSTIIVTNKSISKTSKDENGDPTYQEIRKNKNGMEAIINEKNLSLRISGKALSQEEIEKFKSFSKNSDLALVGPPAKLAEKDYDLYEQTLKDLGVNIDINLNDKDKYTRAATAKSRADSNVVKGMSCLYDKNQDFSKPESICLSYTDSSNKFLSKTFRKTQDGNYIDCSSFEVVEGKPKYQLLTLQQIHKYARKNDFSDSVSHSYFKKFEKFQKEDNALIPKAALDIHDKAIKQHEKSLAPEKEDNVQEQ